MYEKSTFVYLFMFATPPSLLDGQLANSYQTPTVLQSKAQKPLQSVCKNLVDKAGTNLQWSASLLILTRFSTQGLWGLAILLHCSILLYRQYYSEQHIRLQSWRATTMQKLAFYLIWHIGFNSSAISQNTNRSNVMC